MIAVSQPAALDPAQHPWLGDAALGLIFRAFADANGEARIVGGAVRNALFDLLVADVDLAVNLPPEEAEQALQKAGIKVKRTGFAHGTITAVLSGRGFEITSLRRDVATDGRYAEVAYTDVWAEDAARRDFTMNALYVDAAGRLYDYHGGVADARAGKVRFIGDASARIAEDYLRILRFFRFYAVYGRGAADPGALAACAEAAPQMAVLSRERVTQEWRKLLLAQNPLPALELMRAHDVLPQILPLDLDIARLRSLMSLKADSSFVVRQAALLPQDKLLEPVLRAALRLSNAELDEALRLSNPALAAPLSAGALPEFLYRHGVSFVRDSLLLQEAGGAITDWPRLLDIVGRWSAPVFPLQGQDLLKLGLESSPRLGEIMRAVENWWIAGGFKADRAACLAEARRLAGVV